MTTAICAVTDIYGCTITKSCNFVDFILILQHLTVLVVDSRGVQRESMYKHSVNLFDKCMLLTSTEQPEES